MAFMRLWDLGSFQVIKNEHDLISLKKVDPFSAPPLSTH